jgi:hypothetical protein
MGGNALKLQTVRLEKKYYEHVAAGTSDVLKQAFPDAKVAVIPAYEEKESFGDLDILISGIPMDKLREFVEKALVSPEYHQNGNVLSFGLEITALLMKRAIFQIDFITVPDEDFDFALKYFAYNDLGNLIGQTAHGVGLKFGHDGLWYKYIVDTQLVKEICITKDFAVALHLLGYSMFEYNAGFRNLEDIFVFTCKSKFFTTWNYQLENRNAVGRVRDKKRKTYMDFLEWMKDKNLPSERMPRDHGFLIAAKERPDVAMEFIHATFDYFRVEKVKKKFNGEFVGLWTGLQGKELGGFMADYRGNDREAFLKRIESMTSEQVEAHVKRVFEEWEKQL